MTAELALTVAGEDSVDDGWWNRALAEQVGRAFEGAPAEGILEWAFDRFGASIVLASSMADAVLIDMASRLRPGLRVLFLDTGYHFAETIGTAAAFADRYDITLVRATPELSVAQQDARYGERLYERDPDLCCALRKVRVLDDALAPYAAWISGIRRGETRARRRTRVVDWDGRRGKVKVNPIATWSDADVERYIVEHDVLVNPLLSVGYDSIGCAPCTVPGRRRDGRWLGTGKMECGIHA